MQYSAIHNEKKKERKKEQTDILLSGKQSVNGKGYEH